MFAWVSGSKTKRAEMGFITTGKRQQNLGDEFRLLAVMSALRSIKRWI